MAYRNRILYNLALPEPVPRVVLGCFHPEALAAEIQIWSKLIGSLDSELIYTILLVGPWTSRELEASLAPSVLKRLEVRPDSGWTELIQPDKPDRSFALLSDGDRAQIAILGAPTEDSWELFESYLGKID